MGQTFVPGPVTSLAVAIPFGFLCAYLIVSLVTAFTNIHAHPLSGFPGPRMRAAFEFPNIWSNLKGFGNKDTKRLHDRYGHVVRIAPNTLSFNTARAWQDIYGLKKDRTELAKDPNYYIKGPAVQIVNADQKEHVRIRKLLAPAFSDTALLEQEPLLNHYFNLLVQKLDEKIDGPANGRVDLMSQYNFLAFDIIGDLALGEPFGALENGENHAWMRNFFEGIKFLGVIRFAMAYPVVGLFFQLLQRLKPSFAEKRIAHLAFTKKKVDERLDRITDRKDFLQYILQGGKDRQNSLSHLEILGNSRVLLTAGSETTATQLCGATWFLLNNLITLQRAQSEVRKAFKNAEDITLRSVSAPGTLPFLNAVIEETLRCYPSIPSTLPRVTAAGGAIIDGHFVPENTSVGVHQWSANRSSSNFGAAESFIPERWLLEEAPSLCANDQKDAMQPFSLGPRGCLGKSLAYFEIRSVLSRVLWHFDLELEDESRNWIDQKEFVFWDKPSLWVKLHRKVA
ncbi:putative benzoate 4-monooxygenase cytochrome P450 [Polyplosphaeria fusca]|uniref:Benzoate 4-monooxygenase cytochrome P450 n=1 Tax=Polyplosphaeria fusca TaxID=682080 RepID=A0A9P4QLY4_9PLEO|nr:putative benzoate 4-monooxygenase cytochrome P450 [Polyplosphaeria fusca]